MAAAFGAVIGQASNIVGGSSAVLVTSAAVPAGGMAVVCVAGYRGTSTSGVVSGGGVTWTVDKQQAAVGDTGYRIGIASAPCPAGLASGTTITVSFSGVFEVCSVQGVYVTGAAATTPVDATGGLGYTTTGTSASATVTTTNADDIIVQCVLVDLTTGDLTPVAGMTEAYDVHNGDTQKVQTCYRVVTSAGAYTIGATWSGAHQWVTAGVAYKAAAAAAGNSRFLALM